MRTPALSLLLCLVLPSAAVVAQTTEAAGKQQLQSDDPEWIVFSPPDKSFTVALPGPPELVHDPILTGDFLPGEDYSSMDATSGGLHFYSVTVFCAHALSAENISLDSFLKSMFPDGRAGHRVSIARITLDGLPAREIVSTKPGDYSRTQWIIAGPRIYMLSFISSKEKELPPTANRFFSSFHVNRTASGSLAECPSVAGRLPVATRGNIHIISFPKDWMDSRPGRRQNLLSAEWYEVRTALNSNKHELLFGAMDYRDSRSAKQQEQWYGRNFYAVRLGSQVHIREVPKAEWKQAATVSRQSDSIFSGAIDDTEPAMFEYHGKEYPKSSEHWGGVILSPSGRWLAVYSYSGKSTQGGILGGFGGGLPHEGDVYWDVYDLRNGEKVLAWTAKLVRNPGLLHTAAVWVDDNYLVMPFDGRLRSCVIGVLPRN